MVKKITKEVYLCEECYAEHDTKWLAKDCEEDDTKGSQSTSSAKGEKQ